MGAGYGIEARVTGAQASLVLTSSRKSGTEAPNRKEPAGHPGEFLFSSCRIKPRCDIPMVQQQS
jgi:hypothetical protein